MISISVKRILHAYAVSILVADVFVRAKEGGMRSQNDNSFKDRALQYTSIDLFYNNSIGYCDLNKTEVQYLGNLMATDVELIDVFLEEFIMDGETTEYSIPSLDAFVDLTRKYLESTGGITSDRDILAVTMKKRMNGRPEEMLTSECKNALAESILESTAVWMELMGVGKRGNLFIGDLQSESIIFVGGEELFNEEVSFGNSTISASTTNSVDDNLPEFLDIFAGTETPVFEKFVESILLKSDVVGVDTVLDREYVFFVESWKEMVATSGSFPSKYAAFALTRGMDLVIPFNIGDYTTILESLYQTSVDVCGIEPGSFSSPTTPQPSTPSEPEIDGIEKEQLVPVVAVVEKGGPSKEELALSWSSFRDRYPDRKFCLLQLRSSDYDDLLIPSNFLSDANTIAKSVSRDENDGLEISHWFNLCDLQNLKPGEEVALLLSVPVVSVQASYNYFLNYMERKNIVRDDVVSSTTDDNWIEPFLSREPDTPANRSAMPSSLPSPMPSIQSKSPSLSMVPSSRPSEAFEPSASPSVAPTSEIPSFAPSNSPSLTMNPSVQPSTESTKSAVPSATPSASPSESTFPTAQPSLAPSFQPTSEAPSVNPSNSPTFTVRPSAEPTLSPVTPQPTTGVPSFLPSSSPTSTESPSSEPTLAPITPQPTTNIPSSIPSSSPTSTTEPSAEPSNTTPSPSTIEGDAATQTFDISFSFQSVDNTELFIRGAQTWTNVIAGDIPDVTDLSFSTGCGRVPSTIDDLHICARFLYIDGPGGVLGSAQV